MFPTHVETQLYRDLKDADAADLIAFLVTVIGGFLLVGSKWIPGLFDFTFGATVLMADDYFRRPKQCRGRFRHFIRGLYYRAYPMKAGQRLELRFWVILLLALVNTMFVAFRHAPK